jgi:hypothetical protein
MINMKQWFTQWQVARWNSAFGWLENRVPCGGSRKPNYYGCKSFYRN